MREENVKLGSEETRYMYVYIGSKKMCCEEDKVQETLQLY